jgi:hypothetical protein
MAITIREGHPAVDLLAEETVLCGKIRIAQLEFFVNRRRDRYQQFLPVHTAFHPSHDFLH